MRESQSSGNATYLYQPPYRMSFQQAAPVTLVPFTSNAMNMRIEEIPENPLPREYVDLTPLNQCWKDYFDKTKLLFEEGLQKRPHLTLTPLTLFQTLTRSNEIPKDPSAHLFALLFYVSDVFFGHFLKTKLISDDRVQMYSYFIEQYFPTLASSNENWDDYTIVFSNLYKLLLTECRTTFFQHWINSDVILCIQDLCRLCWAYEVGVTVDQTRRWVEEGIFLFFQWKAMIPDLTFYFPQLHSPADPEKMILHPSAAPEKSKVLFTYWPGIFDPESNQILQKAWVWHT
ncbi:hypothetical protein HMI56_002265 [Coelomomyces lativittatus]|nr:hypothetical protein HMI56_002265 [Coelomomyces lativittatus]